MSSGRTVPEHRGVSTNSALVFPRHLPHLTIIQADIDLDCNDNPSSGSVYKVRSQSLATKSSRFDNKAY
ncbi:Protein of unknown function [Pyronema omphalodes CBS 100304]|uniref:Uncharacterized protein n=1 Tax=Pyronema omphalodes (strain CBS 100304) TaxID=1076935 RepID=U4LNX2_PYROM|nr:Protein of unknown function [Pyronema omphalodes CBS 100304]